MKEINFKIKRNDLFLISAIVVFLVGAGFVVAYNANWQTTPTGNPVVMGHSPDEIIIKDSTTGNPITLNQWISNYGGSGGCSFGEVTARHVKENTPVYYAATDMIVMASSNEGAYEIAGWVDSSSFTARVAANLSTGNNVPAPPSWPRARYSSASLGRGSITFAVKRGEYWQVMTKPDNVINYVYNMSLNCGSGSGGTGSLSCNIKQSTAANPTLCCDSGYVATGMNVPEISSQAYWNDLSCVKFEAAASVKNKQIMCCKI